MTINRLSKTLTTYSIILMTILPPISNSYYVYFSKNCSSINLFDIYFSIYNVKHNNYCLSIDFFGVYFYIYDSANFNNRKRTVHV